MNLKILLPSQVFVEKKDVSRIVTETSDGAFGLYPHRLDCVAALVPGILIYESESAGEVFVAIDQGILIKTGFNVLISVQRAISGNDLNQLRDLVKYEFLEIDENEKKARVAIAKLENNLMRRLVELRNE